MDTNLFSALINNLLNISVVVYKDDDKVLDKFEEAFCFHKTLQPMYSKKSLLFLFENTKDYTFYVISDQLFTNTILFKYVDNYFVVGPFLKANITTDSLQTKLASDGITQNVLHPLKLYHAKLSKMNVSWVQSTIIACLRSFDPMLPDFTTRMLTGFKEDLDIPDIISTANEEYGTIEKRYEAENYFLNMIREGDITAVTIALNQIKNIDQYKDDPDFNISAYSSNHNGDTVLRTLARKAAEEGGCSVIRINEITQNAINKQAIAKSSFENNQIMTTMILELTKAVADAKAYSIYSPPVRKTLMYLKSQYSEDISLNVLAKRVSVTPQYLSRLFKKETSKTIMEYVTNLRLEKACSMLAKDELDIADISSYVGYQDNNYFTKVFKKRYGMTPSAYRNSKI